jgi:DMSO/TMAO reductase YedYZ molybdopterin-dependent catalytic subunit
MDGPRLANLHRYNGWNLVFLILSGAILYTPAFRGPLGPARVALKYLHILSGLLSVGLLLAYLPLGPGHWRRLAGRVGQKANVVLIVSFLAGWALSGLALWWGRYLPQVWAQTALIWHDRLTWFVLPWVLAHAATRYFHWRLWPVSLPAPASPAAAGSEAQAAGRRVFLAGAATVVGAIAWSRLARRLGVPGFESSAAAGGSTGGAASGHQPLDPNTEFHPPVVSNPPKGGGGQGRFRVYTVTDIPTFREADWTFTAAGLVDRPLQLSWQEFLALPRTVQVSDFHCVTGWSVFHVTWEGVRLSDLLDRLGVKNEARFVRFFSGDGVYDDSLPVAVARAEDVMLAYVMDGSPLPTPLGGPVRLIVPKMYGYKSVKWVEGLQLTAEEKTGYWEQRGYPADAWVQWDAKEGY